MDATPPAGSNFEVCVEVVRINEGGTVERASDPGGATNFGITQRVLDSARSLMPGLPRAVESLTWAEAKGVYKRHYWSAIRGDELPLPYALITLDAAVNHGPNRAVRFLQQGLGVKVDGWIGAETLAGAHIKVSPEALEECMARRAFFFMLQDSMDDEYGLGWARRVMRTFSAALQALERHYA